MSQDMPAEKDLATEVDAAPEGTTPEPATAPEAPVEAPAAPEPAADVPPEIRRIRQWVTLRGSSMDARVGVGLADTIAKDLRSAIGRPHGCALIHEAGAPEGLVRDLARGLSDQGFELAITELAPCSPDLAGVEAFCAHLAEAHITADDLVVVCGREETLSVASFSCASWCGGVSLAEVPLTLSAALTAGTTPRALDVAGHTGLLERDGSARFSIMDAALYDFDPATEDAQLAFATMVATAMCDSDKAFGRLWDDAEALAAGDVATLVARLADSVKSRGKVVSSSALSTRQSITYGQLFATALGRVAGPGVPASVLLAEGLRFSARLSVALEYLSVDDMFTQDELLEKLGVGTCEVAVDADALVEALLEERYVRSRRLMLPLPRALGRVRLATVEDDLLREHVSAWAAARSS